MADARRIVVVTAREDLRAAVMRLAALAGVEVAVVTASTGVRSVWRSARAVLVGSDLAAAVAAAGLPRRSDVVVLTIEEPPAELWRWVVELGATRLMSLPAEERALVELMSDAVETQTPGASVIAVVGGCGGAGASTFAAALAVSCVSSGRTVLIDADTCGGGLDVLLGAEQSPGARWPDLASTRGRLSAAALTEALVDVDGLAVLSWDRSGSADLRADTAAAVMDAAIRGFQWVIVDLPRHLDTAALSFAGAAELVIVVVPATVRAVAAAATIAAAVVSQCGQVQLVVRDARAGHLGAAEIAAALGLSVAASVNSEAAVVAAAERGEPPLRRHKGSLYGACQGVLSAVALEAAA